MSEYKMSHTGAELDEAIRRFNDGYILPIGDSPIITTNGSHPVRQYENAVVNVSNLTKYTSGNVTFASVVTGIQNTYDSSQLIIDVAAFSPKIFIFRPASYDISKTLTKYSKNYHLLTSSICVYDGLVENATVNNKMGSMFSTIITKTTASGSTISGAESVISVNGIGFRKKSEDSTEVYFYCNQTGYAIRNGTWFWEAYA